MTDILNLSLGGMAAIVDASKHPGVTQIPEGFECHTLKWRGFPGTSLPAGLKVWQKLDLSGSPALKRLPDGLSVPVLNLTGCVALEQLPEGLRADFLVIDGCTSLRHWPESAHVGIGSVSARNCTSLMRLPASLGPLTSLDIRDCSRIDCVPESVQVREWIDVGGTGIESLPSSLSKTALRWRGVRIDARIAFFPESLTADEVLAEANAEVRRVMIERMGITRFLEESKAEVLHQDEDAGGWRRLLRVALAGDEPLVCVSVNCPSTGRHYLIRVPPSMRSCHEAVAWTAGFDNPDHYRPVAET